MSEQTPDIDALLGSMSIEQKVGQMFMLAFEGRRLEEARTLLAEHGVGACYISQDNAATPAEAVALTNALQGYAPIPVILGVDQEGAWGVLVPHSTTGPGNMALGAAGDRELIGEMYRVIGTEMAAVGYNTLLAPCVDVNSNSDNPIIGTRSFGQRPQEVATMAAAAVRGAAAGGVITTAKHYPGHGDTATDSHRGLPRVERSREELEASDLLPFRAAVAAGVDIVMTSHILYPALDPDNPATMSAAILQNLLREDMGFGGVILSDSMNMGAIRSNYTPNEAAVLAVLAGVDMIMLAEEHYDHDAEHYLDNQLRAIRGILTAVGDGSISATRIDESVRRVLALKLRAGLFNRTLASEEAAEIVGSAAHREVEMRAARAAMTLVRNSGILPLPADKSVLIINTTPRNAYDTIGTQATRGIGPNQDLDAFDTFAEEMLRTRTGTEVMIFEEVTANSDLPDAVLRADIVLAVSENYPLPGTTFGTPASAELIAQLAHVLGDKLAVIALRDPYDLAHFPAISTYLCSHSSRECSARAAVEVVLGAAEAGGRLPVEAMRNA